MAIFYCGELQLFQHMCASRRPRETCLTNLESKGQGLNSACKIKVKQQPNPNYKCCLPYNLRPKYLILKIFLDFLFSQCYGPIHWQGETFKSQPALFLGVIIIKTPVGKAQMTLEFFNTSDWNYDWKNSQLYVT